MHLAQGCGARGGMVEALEAALPVGAELTDHPAPHERPAHRRRVGLQLDQLADIFLGQRVGDRGEELRHLHQGALDAAERGTQIGGVALAVDREAKIALAGEPRREATHRAADPRIAAHPAGKAVLVGHVLLKLAVGGKAKRIPPNPANPPGVAPRCSRRIATIESDGMRFAFSPCSFIMPGATIDTVLWEERKMKRIFFTLAAAAALATLIAPAAEAQAPRTFVSGTGSDASPCSRTAPCRNFAAALAVTAAGGDIVALDPAGYGPVTIAQ